MVHVNRCPLGPINCQASRQHSSELAWPITWLAHVTASLIIAADMGQITGEWLLESRAYKGEIGMSESWASSPGLP